MKIQELNEATSDPVMKLRLELAKLKMTVEDQAEQIKAQDKAIEGLQRTVGTLIRKLGPKS